MPEFEARPADAAADRVAVAQCAAAATVLLAVMQAFRWPQALLQLDAATLALLGVMAVTLLLGGNVSRYDLTLRPRQGWRHWTAAGLAIGAVLGLLIILFGIAAWITGMRLEIPRLDPEVLPQHLLWMCVYAPLVEEVIYRFLLRVAVEPWAGRCGTILISGLVFAAVHHGYGNPSVENQLGGFLLAWAYLKSESLMVPLALHSLGNGVALAAQLANWHWMPPVLGASWTRAGVALV